MKAAAIVAFGATDRIQIADIPRPKIKPDEVLIRVKAAAVNPILKHGGTWVSTVVQPHVFSSVAATLFFSSKRAKLVIVKIRCEDLAQIRQWVDAGKLKPIIHSVYPLDRIRDAHAQQESKHTRGKLVIRID